MTCFLLADSRIDSRAVLKAFSISSPAIENAFSISRPILDSASFNSSHGAEMPASTPLLVLDPHLGQKYASSGSSSPHLEQNNKSPGIKNMKRMT